MVSREVSRLFIDWRICKTTPSSAYPRCRSSCAIWLRTERTWLVFENPENIGIDICKPTLIGCCHQKLFDDACAMASPVPPSGFEPPPIMLLKSMRSMSLPVYIAEPNAAMVGILWVWISLT